jgi:diguanylate cyclase
MEERRLLSVLAVEDSSADARALRALLRDADPESEIRQVSSLEEAAQALAGALTPPDVLLLDLGLPDGDGIENVERMRAAAPDSAIVVLTGRDDDGMALQALRNGAQEYLLKGSYDGELLMRTLRHAIERHGLIRELSNEREREYFRASHDLLTGLPNRQLFLDRAQVALHKGVRSGEHFAVCFFDLDGFKTVNDRHGHAIGDALLREVAHVLRQGLRDSDTVARVGGDEFMVLLSPVSLAAGDDEAARVVQRLIRRVAAISRAGDRDVNIGASAGFALCPAHGTTLEMLVARADEAMYRAKRGGKGRAVQWAPLPTAAAAAAPAGSIDLCYRPLHDAQGRLAGYSAHAPAGAPPLPARRLLAQALIDWRDAGLNEAPLFLAVPVSGADLHKAESVPLWLEELRRAGLPPERLRLDIAVEELEAGSEHGLAGLTALRAAGVRVAVRIAATDLNLVRLVDRPFDAVVLGDAWAPLLAADDRRADAVLCGLRACLDVLGRELLLPASPQTVLTARQLRGLA